MSSYIYNLSDVIQSDNENEIIDFNLKAGNELYNIHIRWFPADVEEQLNYLMDSIRRLRNTEPLKDSITGQIVRDYDYLEYYLSIQDIQEWLATSTLLPIYLASIEDKVAKIQEKIDECTLLNIAINRYKECAKWYITCTNSLGEVEDIRLNVNSLARFSNSTILFEAPNLNTIDFKDLFRVNLRIEVV